MDPVFLRSNGIGKRLTPSGTTSTAAVAIGGKGDSLIVSNVGSSIAYFVMGDSTVSAPVPGSTVGYPVMPQDKESEFVIDPAESFYNNLYVAANCDTGKSTTLTFHRVGR